MENLENTNVEEGQETETQAKTYTQEEVDALLQQETDRRVTSALKKQAEKNQAKVREAEKLAKMDSDQRYQYELEQREAAIAEKEKQLALAENKAVASQILADKGISANLVNFVVSESADEMNENIKLLEKEFKLCVKKEVEARLASKTPTQSLPLDKPVTKSDLSKMSYSQLLQLKAEQPELFNEFSK